MPAGSAQVGFYVQDSQLESITITAQATGLASANLPIEFFQGQKPPVPIQHVIVIMQENRSYDQYFGTYPGGTGLPVDQNGNFTACLSIPTPLPTPTPAPPPGYQPNYPNCVFPYHDRNGVNNGSGHSNGDALADIDNYKMDGFATTQFNDAQNGGSCNGGDNPDCSNGWVGFDVMGFHTRDEIPNYWAYADHFVLQDHLFEPALSWSLISHLYLVSQWAANCTNPSDPMSCSTNLNAFNQTNDGMLASLPRNVTLIFGAPAGVPPGLAPRLVEIRQKSGGFIC
jgi:phospholipase C